MSQLLSREIFLQKQLQTHLTKDRCSSLRCHLQQIYPAVAVAYWIRPLDSIITPLLIPRQKQNSHSHKSIAGVQAHSSSFLTHAGSSIAKLFPKLAQMSPLAGLCYGNDHSTVPMYIIPIIIHYFSFRKCHGPPHQEYVCRFALAYLQIYAQ